MKDFREDTVSVMCYIRIVKSAKQFNNKVSIYMITGEVLFCDVTLHIVCICD